MLSKQPYANRTNTQEIETVPRGVSEVCERRCTMNKKFLALLDEKFSSGLQEKTGWGRVEVLMLFRKCVAEAAIEVLDAL